MPRRRRRGSGSTVNVAALRGSSVYDRWGRFIPRPTSQPANALSGTWRVGPTAPCVFFPRRR
jgi:hypothetical protein